MLRRWAGDNNVIDINEKIDESGTVIVDKKGRVSYGVLKTKGY